MANPLTAAPPTTAPAVWVAGESGVQRISTVDLAAGVVAETLGAGGLAVDTEQESAWVYADGWLSLYAADGGRRGRFPVERGRSGRARLVALPLDGSVWLASDRRLLGFGVHGQPHHELELDAPAVGLALDEVRSRLWAVSETSVVPYDAVSGERLAPLGIESAVRALAIDPTSGELWLATAEELLRYTAEGEILGTIELADVETLLHVPGNDEDPATWWAFSGPTARLLDGEGQELLALEPFGAEGRIEAATVEEGTRALWLAGRPPADEAEATAPEPELVRLSASGWELKRTRIAETGEIRGLGLLPRMHDDAPPRLQIVSPRHGEILRSTRPPIRIRFDDAGSGVRRGSLRLLLDGTTLEVTCDETPWHARCELDSDLAEGTFSLSATVADESGQVSEPAVTEFTISAAATDPGGAGGSTYTPIASPRGFETNKPYHSPTEIDHVDPASGNLVLRIPLGQAYTVGPLLSYQLQAVYNSNAWDIDPIDCTYSEDILCGINAPSFASFAIPNPQSNAGIGWEVHLGKLYPPKIPFGFNPVAGTIWPNRTADGEDFGTRWMYVAPDGSSTYLHSLPGRDNGTDALPIRYSKDGSFVRMRQISASEIQVHFPDGRVSVFEASAAVAGTDFCGNGVSGCWRLKEIRDPHGNKITLSYALVGTLETWTVADSTGRSHLLTFDLSNAATAGGNGTYPFWTSSTEKDEWGDLRRVLTKVEVAAFGGATARYDFVYSNRSLVRACPHDGEHLVASGAHVITTPVLERIDVPHSQPWRITTMGSATGGLCDDYSARVSEVTAPSRGKVAYTYKHWYHPTVCSYTNDPELDWDYLALGIGSRRTVRPDGTTEGTWTYSSQLYPTSGLVESGPSCSRATYRRSVVQEPVGTNGRHTEKVYYSSVFQGLQHVSATTPIDSWQITDNGLPFTKAFTAGTSSADRTYLSQELLDCQGTTCRKERATYLRYQVEWRPCSTAIGDSPGCWQVNPTVHRQRTVYPLDGNRYVEVANEQYDGAGHYRRVVTTDNFDTTVTTRSDDTAYTATGATTLAISATTGYLAPGTPASYLPAAAAPWILHPYSKQTSVEGGRTYVTEAEFDAKGSLTCSRRWKASTARTVKDLVTQLVYGTAIGVDAGLPVQEIVAGGEGAALSTATLCSTVGTAAAGTRFQLDHDYQDLTLRSTAIAGYPYWYRAAIDPSTGLPTATYDATDQATTYQFDLLGRLTRATPATSLAAAITEVVYTNTASADPTVRTRQLDGTTVLVENTTVYDGLGRVFEEQTRRPNGVGYKVSKKQTLYDAAGRVERTTTLQDTVGFNSLLATVVTAYDAFDRPKSLMRPDGSIETRTYLGERVETSTVRVQQTSTTSSNVATQTFKDARGRVAKVVQGNAHTTLYTYDPYDRQVTARRTGTGVDQLRSYAYDARGLLLSESLPELGSNSLNGTVTYSPDAFGQPRRLQDGRVDLTYGYDAAGRLMTVYETFGGRLWKEWVYGTANNLDDLAKGKVVRAIRHNYPAAPLAGDWAVVEEYTYKGTNGQMNRRTTQLQRRDLADPDRSRAYFSQLFGYDKLGNLNWQEYPKCQTTPQNGRLFCDDTNDLPPTDNRITVTHNSGLVVGVSSNLGGSATFAYHPNLQLQSSTYGNGVVGLFDHGSNGMPRPTRLRYHKGGVDRFDTGTLSYDAAGNAWAVGADRYVYDQASRLVSAAVAGKAQTFGYDAADNITWTQTGTNAVKQHNVVVASNRMLGPTGDMTYDVSGNVTGVGTKSPGVPIYGMTYDAIGMQARFTDRGLNPQRDWLYVYGPGDYRFLVHDTGTNTRTVKLRGRGAEILREHTVTGDGHYQSASLPGEAWTHLQDFVHGPSGLLATRTRTGVLRYYHQDHLGSTRAITDSTGTLVGRRDYFPFGEEINTSWGLDEKAVKYTGHERDPQGFTDYMLGRTYLWPYGRFASPDRARDGWNLYTYVGNNPLGHVDPTGHTSQSIKLDRDLRTIANHLPTPEEIQDDREVAVLLTVTVVTEIAVGKGLGLLAKVPAIARFLGLGRAGSRAEEALAAREASRLIGPGTTYGAKIEGQLEKRGWTKKLVESTIDDPVRTVATRDTRHLPGGGRLDEPATAYYSRRGGYVVRSDQSGDIVQLSDRTDSSWRAPWD